MNERDRTHGEKPSERIEELKKDLYSREGVTRRPVDTTIHDIDHTLPEDWEDDNSSQTMAGKKKKGTVSGLILTISILFFLGAFAFAGFSILRGLNTVSSKNISISISGPTSVEAGTPIELDVLVRNGNEVDLQSATLYVEYPAGSRSVHNTNEEHRRDVIELDGIRQGEVAETSISTIFFGSEGTKKTINFGVEYRLPNSGATFYVERTYDVEISSSPVSLEVDVPREVGSGEVFDMTVTVTSNAEEVIDNALLLIDYPFGFQLSEAEPEATFDNDVWVLGDMAPEAKRTITLTGRLSGQQDEERAFLVEVGTQHPRDEKRIGTPFVEYSQEIVIRKPVLSTTLSLGGTTSGTYSAGAGSEVEGTIEWQNGSAASVRDAEIQLTINGDSIDIASLRAPQGQVRQDLKGIVWTSDTESRLADIKAGAGGALNFSFQLKDPEDVSFGSEAVINVRMSARGSSGAIETLVSRTVAVSADISLSSSARFVRGETPPQPGEESTYTISWDMENTVNDAGDLVVSARLPEYVEWLLGDGAGNVSYDASSRIVTWNVGDVRAGSRASASFDVVLVPEDEFDRLALIDEVRVEGEDLVTGASISLSPNSVFVIGEGPR